MEIHIWSAKGKKQLCYSLYTTPEMNNGLCVVVAEAK